MATLEEFCNVDSDEASEDEYSFEDSDEGLDDEEVMAKYSEYTMTEYGCYKPDETDSPIVLAAKRGDISKVEKILKESGNSLKVLNSARKWTEVEEKYGYDKSWEWFGDTPLIGAASGGYFRIVKLLLLLGADPTLVSSPSCDQYVCAIDGLNNNAGASEKTLRWMETEIKEILNGTLSSYHSLIKSTIDAKDSAKNLLEQIERQKVTSSMIKAVAPFWKYVNASSAGADACGKRGDNKASDEDAMKAALEDVSTELVYDVSKVEPLAEAITNLRKKHCKPTVSARPANLGLKRNHQGSLLQGSQQCQGQGCDKIPAKACVHTSCAKCCRGPCQRHSK